VARLVGFPHFVGCKGPRSQSEASGAATNGSCVIPLRQSPSVATAYLGASGGEASALVTCFGDQTREHAEIGAVIGAIRIGHVIGGRQDAGVRGPRP
jgi:hypothetical protein